MRHREDRAGSTRSSTTSRTGTRSEVPALPTDRVLNVLHYIKWYLDGTLTFRRSCAHGVCGSDAMRINGVNRLACKVLIKDLLASGGKPITITVEPIKGLPVLKDLVVDMEPFFEAFRAVKPFLITYGNEPTRERVQSHRRPRAVRRHHQVHPVRRVHHVVPGVLDRGRLLRPGGDRQRAPLHLRQPRRGRRGAAGDPQRRRRASGAAARPSTAPTPAPAASRSPRRSRKSSAPSSSGASDPTPPESHLSPRPQSERSAYARVLRSARESPTSSTPEFNAQYTDRSS